MSGDFPPARVEMAYHALIEKRKITGDPSQLKALAALARLERDLNSRPRTLFRNRPIRGVYLYGPVGRGKTLLMNLFYQTLPLEAKLRLHFHAFMLEEIHAKLKRLGNVRDPIPRLAKSLARRIRVLCFDELIVEDIADAMLLGMLFETLFDHGVALVTTANVPPHGLYRDGLQRDRFLPAIRTLETHCQVIDISGARDYRHEHLGAAGAYRVSADTVGIRSALARLFSALTGAEPAARELVVNLRKLRVMGVNADTLLVDFTTLCEGPRAPADYLDLAKRYRTILLTDVPRLDDDRLEATRRFIALVDILYENHTILVITAAAEPGSLYSGKRFHFEFRRTASRLEEMRSAAYLGTAHLAPIATFTPL